jgi:predicted phage tail protein
LTTKGLEGLILSAETLDRHVDQPKMSEPSAHGPKKTPLGPGGWFVAVVLVLILAASIWFAFYGWNLTEGEVSRSGMIALILGIVLSMVLGGGLMALVFWSNRKGYDR